VATDQDKNMGWLIRPSPNGNKVIDIHRSYTEVFIRRMLRRYYSSKWMSLLRRDKGDIAQSVILAAAARIDTGFPQLLRKQLPT